MAVQQKHGLRGAATSILDNAGALLGNLIIPVNSVCRVIAIEAKSMEDDSLNTMFESRKDFTSTKEDRDALAAEIFG